MPQGFRRALGKGPQEPASDDPPATTRSQLLTQGVNIRLPFEQSANPEIDVALELVHFPTRKLLLYENSLGTVVFPGGFGTLDELFEVWRMRATGLLEAPIVLFGSEYWAPLIAVLRRAWVDGPYPLVDPAIFECLRIMDDPAAIVRALTAAPSRGFVEDPTVMGPRMARELMEGLEALEALPDAVTVLGGTQLRPHDRELEIARDLAHALAASGVPTRACGPGPFSMALVRGGHARDPFLAQQAFGVRRRDRDLLYAGDRIHVVSDRLTHKVLLTEGARAFVVLPGGLGTFDELFSILCQLQTQKIAHRRIVLIGEAFFRPIVESLRALFLDGPRRTISPTDLDLFSITDDPIEAAGLCLEPLAPPVPRT